MSSNVVFKSPDNLNVRGKVHWCKGVTEVKLEAAKHDPRRHWSQFYCPLNYMYPWYRYRPIELNPARGTITNTRKRTT